VQDVLMGDIVRPVRCRCGSRAEVIGTAPVERVDICTGCMSPTSFVPTPPPIWSPRSRALGRRRVSRARGRETHWQGGLTIAGTASCVPHQ
jgi:hypothetical protein